MQSFVLLWVAVFLAAGNCQKNECRVHDGAPGNEGTTGRDGLAGQKGEKGEPTLQAGSVGMTGLKGHQGSRGPPGEIGSKGHPGVVGPVGFLGFPGPKGASGASTGISNEKLSAFSVVRTNKDYPVHDKPVTFDEAVTDINKDFNLATGHFICKVSGVYYFVFHSMSEGKLCLKLKSDVSPDLSFCDFNKRKSTQLLSGGAVLQLAKGKKVWVEAFKNPSSSAGNIMTKTQERSIVFNGFLVYPSL